MYILLSLLFLNKLSDIPIYIYIVLGFSLLYIIHFIYTSITIFKSEKFLTKKLGIVKRMLKTKNIDKDITFFINKYIEIYNLQDKEQEIFTLFDRYLNNKGIDVCILDFYSDNNIKKIKKVVNAIIKDLENYS